MLVICYKIITQFQRKQDGKVHGNWKLTPHVLFKGL
jgi:hypothetical protein